MTTIRRLPDNRHGSKRLDSLPVAAQQPLRGRRAEPIPGGSGDEPSLSKAVPQLRLQTGKVPGRPHPKGGPKTGLIPGVHLGFALVSGPGITVCY